MATQLIANTIHRRTSRPLPAFLQNAHACCRTAAPAPGIRSTATTCATRHRTFSTAIHIRRRPAAANKGLWSRHQQSLPARSSGAAVMGAFLPVTAVIVYLAVSLLNIVEPLWHISIRIRRAPPCRINDEAEPRRRVPLAPSSLLDGSHIHVRPRSRRRNGPCVNSKIIARAAFPDRGRSRLGHGSIPPSARTTRHRDRMFVRARRRWPYWPAT